MKKILVFVLLALLFTGCTKKSKKDYLKCSKTISDTKSSITYLNTYTFDNKVLTNVSNDMSLNFMENNEEQFNQFKIYAEATKNEYNKKKGVDSTLEISNNTINLVVNYDISSMINDEIINNNFNFDYNMLKDKLEQDGYTCK